MSNTKAECSDNHTQVGQSAGDLLHIHWKQTVGTIGSWEGAGHKAYSWIIYKLMVTLFHMWFPEGLCGRVNSNIKTQFPSSDSVDRIVIALTNLCKDKMASQIKQRPLKDILISTALANAWELTTGSELCQGVFVTCFANSELVFTYKWLFSSVFHGSYNWSIYVFDHRVKISRKILSINKQSQ